MAKRGRPSKTAKAESGSAPSGATPGHNSALSDDERQALHWEHVRDYEVVLAAKKKADADIKNVGKRIKAEGDSVAKVQITIALRTPEGEAAFKARIQEEMEVAAWNGVGVQTELFGDADLMPAVDKKYADGKRDGLAGNPCRPECDASVPQYKSYMTGFHEGQAVLAKGIKTTEAEPIGMPERGLNLGDAAPTHTVVA